jgi:SAM-dependent methyltransferase
MPSFISFIPTPETDVDSFFELAPVSSSDVVYDLGSGDGRLLFAALEKGAGRAVGIDLDPERVREGQEAARKRGVDHRVTFIQGDVIDADLSGATVILCYLITAASAALKPKFEAELKPGTRIVMESFPVPGWRALKTRNLSYKTFYLYRMPPDVEEAAQMPH